MRKNIAVAFSLAFALLFGGGTAPADEPEQLKVLSAGIMQFPLKDITPNYERMTGEKLVITYDFAGAVKARFQKGEAADVVILPKAEIAAFVKAKKIAADSVRVIARSGVALGTRKGAAKPDIGSAAAVKKTLLEAKSIAYFDPASGAQDAVQLKRVLDKLGIAKQVGAKAKPWKSPDDATAEKDAEIVITQPAGIIASANYDLVGMLPAPMQDPERFTWAAGAASRAADLGAARDLVRFLAAPNSAAVFKAKGMPPP